MSADELSHLGYVRAFVRMWEKDPNDKWDKGIEIMSMETFELGLRSTPGRHDCIHEEVDLDELSTLLEDKPHGFYEIYGKFYYGAWQCGYEYEEWDAAAELRDVEIRQLKSWDEAFEHVPEYELFEKRFELDEFGGITLFAEQDDKETYKKLYGFMMKSFKMQHLPLIQIPLDASTEVYVKWFDNVIANNNLLKEYNLKPVSEFLMERELLIRA